VDELVKQITERTGISETQARTAVDTVVGFLKTRLPEPIGGQVDSVLTGGANVAGDVIGKVGDMAGGMLGGVLGGNKD
jgi:hypothetical protein